MMMVVVMMIMMIMIMAWPAARYPSKIGLHELRRGSDDYNNKSRTLGLELAMR